MRRGDEFLFWGMVVFGYLAMLFGLVSCGWHLHRFLTGP